MHRLFRPLLTMAAVAALAASFVPAYAAPKVVVSIKPIHSLVSSIMGDIGKPTLLLEGNTSPHDASLKPSQARAIQDADVVFWIGPELEGFMTKTIDGLGKKNVSVKLFTAEDEDGDTEAKAAKKDDHDHDHDHGKEAKAAKKDDHDHDHDHGKAKKAAKADDHDHDHDHGKAAKAEDDHGHDHHGHDHSVDPHIWLDPVEMLAKADEIAAALAKADPKNAATYKANADALKKRLKELDKRLAAQLAPIKSASFVTLHDAYGHLMERYGMTGGVAISVNPEQKPGAARVRKLHDDMKKRNVVCLFSEPQFSSSMVASLAEGRDVKVAELDPLGGGIQAGPEQYFTMLDALGTTLSKCLGKSS